VRLFEEVRRQADEIRRLSLIEDRERIAKELHDGVIQSLFAVGMGLQGTVALAKDDDISVRIEGAVDEIDRVIGDLRNYIFGLRPGILADRQLDQALRDLGDEFAARSDVVTIVDVDVSVADELSPIAADVVQLTREALSNIGKHANAVTCRVSLRRDGAGCAVLEIDDDGVGFDPATVTGGMGLVNLAERAIALGGSFDVESVPGEGTLVRATIPI
jgi:two-component system, NarL family, sensor histidine kinase DevS